MPRTLDLNVSVSPGGEVFARRFTRFVSEITDLSDLWELMARDLEATVADAFRTEGSSGGSKWAPLSEAYREQKARAYPGRGILERTRALMRSFERGGAGNVLRIAPRALVWGSSVDYGRYHQSGTSRMPARPIIRLTTETKQDWTRSVHAFLLERARGLATGRFPS